MSFGETNRGFSEIPAIAKKPISGFAKCGPSPLSADHAKAISVRNANFAGSTSIYTVRNTMIQGQKFKLKLIEEEKNLNDQE